MPHRALGGCPFFELNRYVALYYVAIEFGTRVVAPESDVPGISAGEVLRLRSPELGGRG